MNARRTRALNQDRYTQDTTMPTAMETGMPYSVAYVKICMGPLVGPPADSDVNFCTTSMMLT